MMPTTAHCQRCDATSLFLPLVIACLLVYSMLSLSYTSASGRTPTGGITWMHALAGTTATACCTCSSTTA